MNHLGSAFYLVAGVVVAWIGLDGFLLPNHFIDGGVTGLSMLLASLTGLPLSVLLVAVNAPFLAVGYRRIGRMFAAKAALAIFGLALLLALAHVPAATDDKLLGAVFGGTFVGAGVGLAIRGGGVLDGTEILAVLLSRNSFASIGEVILAMNAMIFGVAAFFLGVEPALYSALTYFAASKMIDYVLHGIEAYNGVMIFSANPEPIRQAILTRLQRGVTAFPAKGGYSDAEQQVLFCVVTRLEISGLELLVRELDPGAFVVVSPVHEAHGGVVKKRAFH